MPQDADGQRSIVLDGLEAGAAITTSGTITPLNYRFVDDGWKADPLGWSRKRQSAGTTATPSGDTRSTRSEKPIYQTPDDEAAATSTDG